MSGQAELQNQDNKRRGKDRRRYGMSMIYNYAEYSGPDRRSGEDRRLLAQQRAQMAATAYAV
jgi:hypothetical protein